MFFGLAVPRQFTILPSASYYKPEWGEAYAEFDPDRANELLDAVGLSERDKQGFRVGADGKTFEMAVEYGVGGEAGDPTASLELVKEYWENVGIKVLLKSWGVGLLLGAHARSRARDRVPRRTVERGALVHG